MRTQAAAKELAFLFGGRIASDALPKQGEGVPEGAHLVSPSANERAWIVLKPGLPFECVARVLAAAGAAGMQLVQV